MKELDIILDMGYAVALQPKRLIKGVPTVTVGVIGPLGIYEIHEDNASDGIKQILKEIQRDGNQD